MNRKKALRAIEHHGILLVFPVNNAEDPPSLWNTAYPRSKMRWEWDCGGDDRVARLWQLREELSRSGHVVYSKWYQGRATFFSRDLFRALLCLTRSLPDYSKLTRNARLLLELLEENSPCSTKQLKQESGLQGRALERDYQRALQELWIRLLVVGFGEIDDGAFPSLALGATRWHFEDLYEEAKSLPRSTAEAQVEAQLSRSPRFERFLLRSFARLSEAAD